jgi:predicted alpha/beta hydrolase
MNNIYYISEDDPNQLVDEIGRIEDGYSLRGMDNSRLPDLDDLAGKKRIEYRYNKRFRLNKDAFALIRPIPAGPLKIHGKSMGGIACAVFKAKPARLGKIDNISMGGLMFHHVDSKTQLNQTLVLDILLAGCGFYLANMPFKTITDVMLPYDVLSDAIEMRQVRLQFQKLNAIQQARLKDFIMNHGTEMGELGVKD